MLIGDSFIIGHIPKTGGHALEQALKLANLPVRKTAYRHETFSNINTNNRQLILIFRDLGSWLISATWHQYKHTAINYKNRIMKVGTGESYKEQYKLSKAFLPMPNFLCHSTFPDFTLNVHLGDFSVNWWRMEHLQEDAQNFFGKKIAFPPVEKFSYQPPKAEKYWSEETLTILEKNNPKWSNLQALIY